MKLAGSTAPVTDANRSPRRMGIRDTLVNGPLGFGTAPLGNMFRDIPDDEAAATVDAAREQRARSCGQPSSITAVATWRR